MRSALANTYRIAFEAEPSRQVRANDGAESVSELGTNPGAPHMTQLVLMPLCITIILLQKDMLLSCIRCSRKPVANQGVT